MTEENPEIKLIFKNILIKDNHYENFHVIRISINVKQ